MRLTLKAKLGKFVCVLKIGTLRYSVGVSSKVPDSDYHYSLFDFDGVNAKEKLFKVVNKCIVCGAPFHIYPTVHGYHAIVKVPLTFRETANILIASKVDMNFLTVGLKRGFWFLESSHLFPIPVQFRKDLTFIWSQRI